MTYSARCLASLVLIAGLGCAVRVQAQGHGRTADGVPPGQRPPAGMCRIWFDGLPPGHEPLPMDCGAAFREAPAGARVLVGEGVSSAEYARGERDDEEHGHGRRAGWSEGHGNKDGDDGKGDDDGRHEDQAITRHRPVDCVVYTAGGSCGSVYLPPPPPGAAAPALPDMVGAVLVSRGIAWPEVSRWLGSASLVVHVDAELGGRPSRIRWTDPTGRVVQEWIDTDGDGRADIVRVYRNGVVVRSITR